MTIVRSDINSEIIFVYKAAHVHIRRLKTVFQNMSHIILKINVAQFECPVLGTLTLLQSEWAKSPLVLLSVHDTRKYTTLDVVMT